MSRNPSQQFEILADSVSDIVWVADRRGRCTYVNRHWIEHTGLGLEDACGFGWLKALADGEGDQLRQGWQNAAGADRSFEMEASLLTGSGERQNFRLQARPLNKTASRWLITAVPAVAPGLEREVHCAQALESAGIGYWDLNLETRKISRTLRHDQIFGYRRALPEWRYEDFLQHVVEQDRVPVDQSFQHAVRQSGTWCFECRIYRTDGQIRWVRGSGQLGCRRSDRTWHIWGLLEDVTTRKQAEEALRDSEGHFRALANTAPAMLWISDVQHRCSFLSRGWFEFTGQSDQESLGSGWTSAIHPDDRDRARRVFLSAACSRRAFQVKYRLRNRNGDYRWVLDAGRPRLAEGGGFLGYVGSMIDVHDMQAARNEQETTSELLRAVLDTAPDPIYVKDRQGRLLLANKAAVTAIGKPAGRVMGHNSLEWLEDPQEAQKIHASDQLVMGEGNTQVVEEWITSGISSRLYLSTKSPLRDRHGEVVGLVGISRDVTEQKRVEQQLVESENRMRRLFDSAPASIAIFEGSEHRCVYRNAAHARLMGQRQLLGKTIRQAYPGSENRGILVRFDRVYYTGEPWVTPQVEARHTEGDRPRRIFHETVQPWLHDDGTVAGVMVMAFDMTAEVELRRQVQESGARFRALADNIAQLAWMADERGRIFWYNRRWLDYTGTTLEDMQNSRWQNVHHPDHAQRVSRKISHCLKVGRPLEDTFPLRGADGQYRWFYSQAIPIRDKQGKVTRWFGTHTDVTEQREAAQALEEADRRKNEFLAMLAHELRNPLAPVRYAVEILRTAEAKPDAQVRARETVDRQVAHMAHLIDDLLDVSRITRGKIQLRREPCDLASIVRGIVDEYQLSLKALNLELQYHGPKKPLWVDGDSTRLLQAVGNLLHNAGKFTEPGGRVSVHLHEDARHDHAVITIADTGVGIERDLLVHLFEPFSQASQTLDRSKGGLGLGLSLVKGLVELHGGTVDAVSQGRGQGSSFTLRLPLLHHSATAAPQPCEPEQGEQPRQLRLLVIEDNRDTAESLSTLLRLAGHQVDLAHDGPHGIKLAQQVRPDVVLCDIGLPGGMDGYRVVRKLRRLMSDNAPHFFALSGYGQDSDRRQALLAGFERHFVKPVDYGELREALAAASQELPEQLSHS